MPLIYSLIGTSASGKTTLFERLQQEALAGCSFVPESARRYYQEHAIPKKNRSLFENQSALQQCFIDDLHHALANGAHTIISDSSVLSCIAYTMLGNNQDAVERLIKSLQPHIRRVTFFLLLNPEDIEYQLDPADRVRTESVNARIAVHNHFLDILTNLCLPYREIVGTVEQRLITVKQIMHTQ